MDRVEFIISVHQILRNFQMQLDDEKLYTE